MNNDIKQELHNRKDILNKHLAKFNKLKEESKWSEAWAQLIITLNYANDTLKYSASLLSDISKKMPDISDENSEKIQQLIDVQKSKTEQTPSIKLVDDQKLETKQRVTSQPGLNPKKMIVIPKRSLVH